MAKVKGKFIKLIGMMMMPKEQQLANDFLKVEVGVPYQELKEEEWYDTSIFNQLMDICVKNSTSKDYTYVIIGKKIYPTIKKSAGFPAHLKTPLDFVKFEAEGFLLNHQGSDVVPRKFIKAVDKEVIIKAEAPGYNSKLYEGVFLGILEMCGIKGGKVVNTGDDIFKITW